MADEIGRLANEHALAESDQPGRSPLSRYDFQGARLTNAWWKGIDARAVDFYRAQLQHAGLADAQLEGATLKHADLRHAVLRNAHLQGANLDGALLSGANFEGADLRDVDLGEAKHDGPSQFANAKHGPKRV